MRGFGHYGVASPDGAGSWQAKAPAPRERNAGPRAAAHSGAGMLRVDAARGGEAGR
jgi:hypothetical protein